jgi:hypothetical protein
MLSFMVEFILSVTEFYLIYLKTQYELHFKHMKSNIKNMYNI